MFLWYAYRMDITVFGSGNTILAPGCIGTVSDRSCYFDEFLRYIQRTGPTTAAWTGSTTVGTDLNPDVLSTANELATSGTAETPSRYSNTVEPAKLFPNKFVMGASPSFGVVMGSVMDNIQACRQAVVNDEGISEELDNARRAMVSVHEARLADQAALVLTGVNTQLANAGYSWVRIDRVPQTLYNSSKRFSFVEIWLVTNSHTRPDGGNQDQRGTGSVHVDID